jgi:hypothetical protein
MSKLEGDVNDLHHLSLNKLITLSHIQRKKDLTPSKDLVGTNSES